MGSRLHRSGNDAKTVARSEKPLIWTFPGLGVSSDSKTILYAQSEQNASVIMLAELPK